MSTQTQNQTKGIEFVHCNLCGLNEPELVYEAPVRQYRAGIYNREVWNIVRCRKCGLIYTNPRIDEKARASFYSFETPGDRAFVDDWFAESADLQRSQWRRFIAVVKRFCPAGRLLDIGCGTGSFLVEARAAGFSVCGQEVSPYFIDYCRREHGLTVYGDFLENLDLQPASFDCVTAFDVIEHHPDPKQMMVQMRELLRPGGIAVISTHDFGNPFARLYNVKWRYIEPIGHITYFTRQTLTKMLEDCGFRIVQVGGIHTIDDTRLKEGRHYLLQFFKVVLLRSFILGVYRPLAERIPLVARWRITWGNVDLNHSKLLTRAGPQVAMNDDIVVVVQSH